VMAGPRPAIPSKHEVHAVLKVVLRRLVWTAPFLLVVSLFSFVLSNLAPGSSAETMLGIGATPDAVAALEAEMGLDQPMVVQYWRWLSGVLTGNLGASLYDYRPVTQVLYLRLQPTLSLTILALLIIIILGIAVGIFTAVRGGLAARIIDVIASLLRGVPNFWLAMVLMSIFAVKFRLFPVAGYVPISASTTEWLRALTLPVVALGIGQVAQVAIVVRAEMLQAFRSDFLRSLRANGISDAKIIYRHCLKNVAAPVLTIINLIFVSLLGGTILVEQVFGIGGLGTQMVTSVTQQDLPVVQGIVLFYTVVVVAVFLVNDILLELVNPKVEAS
jgi:peptide/nickel transport system permease protein